MEKLLTEIRECQLCKAHLPLGPKPVVAAHTDSRIVIIGQAPGAKVHRTGVAWDDASGNQLRKWMGITPEIFYDPARIALVPMGFCYPGKGRSGDNPPRPECAPFWHDALLKSMPRIQLTLVIGTYAQEHYLNTSRKKNLTETVWAYKEYLPNYFPLPHPSPRNRFWLSKNPWFQREVVPDLQKVIRAVLEP